MEFYTQRELLEYLGKNPNDRSLVQRMMIRGEILKRDWVYILLDKDRIITELEREVRELRNEIATMKESNWDLEEAKIQWEYWEKECKRYWRLSLNVIDICYNKFKQLLGSRFQESKGDFKEWIIEMAKEMDKGKEKSE